MALRLLWTIQHADTLEITGVPMTSSSDNPTAEPVVTEKMLDAACRAFNKSQARPGIHDRSSMKKALEAAALALAAAPSTPSGGVLDLVKRAAFFGWEHASWNWTNVEIGCEEAAPDFPFREFPETASPVAAPVEAVSDSDGWWRVEVTDHGGQIVAIEQASRARSGMLSGRDIGEDEQRKIENAIGHLQGFIGSPTPAPVESGVGQPVGDDSIRMAMREMISHRNDYYMNSFSIEDIAVAAYKLGMRAVIPSAHSSTNGRGEK